MVMLELAAPERSRPLPPPTFSAPFSSPTLQWPRKKRQRCPNPLVDHHLSARRRLASPSPDPPPSSPSPSTAAAADSRHRASPSPSPAPASSDRPRAPIRPRTGRKDKEDAASACASGDGPRRIKGGEKRKDKEDAASACASDDGPRRIKGGEKRKDKDADEEEEAMRAGSEEGCGVEKMHLRPRAAGGGANGLRKKKKVEMWISLSRDEIEEDYYSITGCKLPRRPKRRPRTAVHPTVLNRIFPGSWLPNTVTLEMYRVHEPAEQRKR